MEKKAQQYLLTKKGKKRVGKVAAVRREFITEFAIKEWIGNAIEKGGRTKEEITAHVIHHAGTLEGGGLLGYDREKVRNLVHGKLGDMLKSGEVAAVGAGGSVIYGGITERRVGLGRSKSPRITPKTPRLRR